MFLFFILLLLLGNIFIIALSERDRERKRIEVRFGRRSGRCSIRSGTGIAIIASTSDGPLHQLNAKVRRFRLSQVKNERKYHKCQNQERTALWYMGEVQQETRPRNPVTVHF